MANQFVKRFCESNSSKLEVSINDFLSNNSTCSIHTLSVCYSEDFEVYMAIVVFNVNDSDQNS